MSKHVPSFEVSFPPRTRSGPRIVTPRMVRKARARLRGAETPAPIRWMRRVLARLLGPTDRDRLDLTFADLCRAGVVARQDFLCCDSCAGGELVWAFGDAERCGITPRGAVFYHRQDRDSARAEGRLLLRFFGKSIDGTDSHRDIADFAIEVLRQHGLEPSWDGNTERCIKVPMRFSRRILWIR